MSENPFERYVNTLDVQWPSVEDAADELVNALAQMAADYEAWRTDYIEALEEIYRDLDEPWAYLDDIDVD